MLLLAHGGTAGLLLELLPVVAIAGLWLWVWRRSRRSEEDASAAARTGDESGVEQDGG